MDKLKVSGATLLTLVLLASGGAAKAQEFQRGDREVVGYAGAIFKGGVATVGVGYGYAVKPLWQIIGELAYVEHGVELGGNIHYLVPLKATPKFTPYLLAGIGIVHQSIDGVGATTGGVNFGGGARWEVGKNWGIRPELKFLAGNHFVTRISGGLYYQFGK